jgi:hypothetical protein
MTAPTNLSSHLPITINRRKPLGLLTLILSAFAVLSTSGCVGLTNAGTPAQKSPSSPTSSGTLASNTPSLNFGNVAAGSSGVQTLTLTNTGAKAVMISQATLTGSSFSIVGSMSSISVAAGQTHALQIKFTPTDAGIVSGSISVDSDATDPFLNVPLSGTGTTSVLAITTQPANQTVTAGQAATFSVLAAGTGTLTYQWKKNGAAITGATAGSYKTPATTSADSGAQFTVLVSDTNGSLTSNSATLTVTATAVAPSITTEPVSKTVNAGQTATFSVAATGTAPLTYRWNKGGVPIGGANSPSYTTPAETTADNGAQFTATVTGAAGTVTSTIATLTVNAVMSVLNVSQTSLNFASVNVGSNSVLPVVLTNGGNVQLTISNVTISGAGFAAGGVQSGQILAPGQTATLNVTFAPAGTGVLPGSVTVSSNAANSPASVALTGTGVQPVSHSVTLAWTASASTASGYNAYRSTVSGGSYAKLNSTPTAATTFTDAVVQAGQTYYYVVTAVDSSGLESGYSAEVSATVP